MEPSFKTFIDMNTDLISRLQEFMENEARSCSMDFGCVTPLYVYRMWGGNTPLKEIEEAMAVI
jgi:hypothetical protein